MEPQHDHGFGFPELSDMFRQRGMDDFRWIDPHSLIVAQWVRMKCMFGCGNYGRCASCPPEVPTIPECRAFFDEYRAGVIFHFPKELERPEDRHDWGRRLNLELVKLEREVFLAGHHKVFLLAMDSCCLCSECATRRTACKLPRQSRPSPEAMGVDVYGSVRQFGFPIAVRSDYHQAMDRYAILLVE